MQFMYSVDNFIADIGGYMGLLLGASVLNLYTMAVGRAKQGNGRIETIYTMKMFPLERKSI